MTRVVRDSTGTPHIFPDDFTPQEMSRFTGVPVDQLDSAMTADSSRVRVNGHFRSFPTTSDADARAVARQQLVEQPYQPPQFRRRERLQSLGALGSMVGSLAGVPGATTGGIAGRAITRMANDIPNLVEGNLNAIPTPKEALDEVLWGGVIGGGSQIAGNILAKPLAPVARWTMGAALRAAPEVAQTALKEGIDFSQRGLKQVMTRLGDLGSRTQMMLRRSMATGTAFDPDQFLSEANQRLATKLAANKLPLALDDAATFTRLSDEFRAVNAGRGLLSPLDLQRIKTDSNLAAEAMFRKLNLGQGSKAVDAGTAAEIRWYKSMAEHAQEMLEQTTPPVIDPVTKQLVTLGEANAQTAKMIELKRAMVGELEDPEEMANLIRSRGPQLTKLGIRAGVGAALGGMAGAAGDQVIPGTPAQDALAGAVIGGGNLLGEALASPQALSRLALLLNARLPLGRLPFGDALARALPEFATTPASALAVSQIPRLGIQAFSPARKVRGQ